MNNTKTLSDDYYNYRDDLVREIGDIIDGSVAKNIETHTTSVTYRHVSIPKVYTRQYDDLYVFSPSDYIITNNKLMLDIKNSNTCESFKTI